MGIPQCPEPWRAAFLGPPTYVRLPAGEHLYKFVSLPFQRERVFQGPWWIRQAAFDDLQQRAMRLRLPMAELVRSQMAIAVEWNAAMDTVFVVVLGQSVDAWEGRAKSQRVSVRDSSLIFTGGGQQLCVPGLNPLQIARDYSGSLARR